MFCYCRKCSPPKWLNKRAVRLHLKDDILHLDSGNYSELYIDKVQLGIDKTLNSLSEFDAGLYFYSFSIINQCSDSYEISGMFTDTYITIRI
jgi:hypothetical protein